MPRRSRVAFAGYPHHLVQRGHNRDAVFFADSDREDYLATLRECRELLSLKIYGYCLMTNHVHLIVDPGTDAANLGKLMKCVAGRHTRRLNRLHSGSGSRWEGRFHCSPIETDRYLLTCGRYVDQNPVRAGIVAKPKDFRWSSYLARAGHVTCDWLDEDPALLELGATPELRHQAYRQIVSIAPDAADMELIRGALQRNQLTGTNAFRTQLKIRFGREVSARTRGRPTKSTSRV
jgi:putative transposase